MLTVDELLQQRYKIIRPVGKGGMGAVYLARDERLGNLVALKEAFFDEEQMRRAFEREARLLASLRHPNLPHVTDHFTEGQGQFLVMEYIAGDDLAELNRQRTAPFELSTVAAWVDQLLDALDYLHTQTPPIIHRDIKPQNLKLSERNQIVLLDFGLAKGRVAGSTQTDSLSLFGYTPAYSPLEQIRGNGTNPRSDLYALAATIYLLLTGVVPPDALARADAIVGQLPDPLQPAHEINPLLPPAVSEVLEQALALNANRRPASASVWRQSWRTALSEAAPAVLGTPHFAPLSALDAAGLMVAENHSTLILPSAQAVDTAGGAEAKATQPVSVISQADPLDASSLAPLPVVPLPVTPLVKRTAKTTTPSKRWAYAAGGIAAASVLSLGLWAFVGGAPATNNANVSETNRNSVNAVMPSATPASDKANESNATPVQAAKESPSATPRPNSRTVKAVEVSETRSAVRKETKPTREPIKEETESEPLPPPPPVPLQPVEEIAPMPTPPPRPMRPGEQWPPPDERRKQRGKGKEKKEKKDRTNDNQPDDDGGAGADLGGLLRERIERRMERNMKREARKRGRADEP